MPPVLGTMKSSLLKFPRVSLSIPPCRSLRVLPSLLLFILSYVETKRQGGSWLWSHLLVNSLEFEEEKGSSRLIATAPVAGQRFAELEEIHRKTRLVEDLAHIVFPHPLQRLQRDSIAEEKALQNNVVRYSNAYPTLERRVEGKEGAGEVNIGNRAEKEEVGEGQTETGEKGEHGVLSLLEHRREKERNNAGGQALGARPSRRDEMREVSPTGGQERGEISLMEERGGGESLEGRLVEKAHATESGEGRESEGNRGEEHRIEVKFEEERKEEELKSKDRGSFVQDEQKRIKERFPEFSPHEPLEKEEREGKEKGNGNEAVGRGTKRKKDMHPLFIEAEAAKPGARNGKEATTFTNKERMSEVADAIEGEEGVKEEAEKDGRGNRGQGNFYAFQQKTLQAGKCNDCGDEKGENNEGKRQEEMREKTSFLLKGMAEELTSADTLENGTSFSETRRRKKSSHRRKAPTAAAEPTAETTHTGFIPYIIRYSTCVQETVRLRPTTAVVAHHAVSVALRALQELRTLDGKDRDQTVTFICGTASGFAEMYHILKVATQGVMSAIDDTGTDLPVPVWMASKLRQYANTNATSSLAKIIKLCAETAELTHTALSATDYLFPENPASPLGALGNYLDIGFLAEGSTSHRIGHEEPERQRSETAFTRPPRTTGPEATASPASHVEIGLQAEREPPTGGVVVEMSGTQTPGAPLTAKEAAKQLKSEDTEKSTETMKMGERHTEREPWEGAIDPAAQGFPSLSSVNQVVAFVLSQCIRQGRSSRRRGVVAFLYALIHVMHVLMHSVRCTLQTQESIPDDERAAMELITLMLADSSQAETHFQFLEGLRHTHTLAEDSGFFGEKKTRERFLDCGTRLEQRGDWSQINDSVLVKGFLKQLMSVLT